MIFSRMMFIWIPKKPHLQRTEPGLHIWEAHFKVGRDHKVPQTQMVSLYIKEVEAQGCKVTCSRWHDYSYGSNNKERILRCSFPVQVHFLLSPRALYPFLFLYEKAKRLQGYLMVSVTMKKINRNFLRTNMSCNYRCYYYNYAVCASSPC